MKKAESEIKKTWLLWGEMLVSERLHSRKTQCLNDMSFVTNFNSVYGDGEMDFRDDLKKKRENQQFWRTALAGNENPQPFCEMWQLEKVNINGKVRKKDFREKRWLSSIQNVCRVLWKCKFQSPQARLPSLWNGPSHMNVREVYKTTAFLWPIHLELLEFPA